jgi:hypothetical protein
MADPWDTAANDITANQAAQKRRLQQEAAAKHAKLQADIATSKAALREIQAAISVAVPKLTTFLNKRGAAAKRLLAARSEHAHIVFGDEREGGAYYSVYLNGEGLMYECGTGGSYGVKREVKRAATPEEAVRAFAYDGRGRNNPKQVREIVDWLTKEVDSRASQ